MMLDPEKTDRAGKNKTHGTVHVTAPPVLQPRERDGHKGDYGRVLIVGGSRGMVGAVALAANAALRGGAGLVTFAAPAPVQLAIASMCPCATSIPLSCGPDGSPDAGAARQVLQAVQTCDVLAIGPGMGVGIGQAGLVRAALEQTRPLVIDADGLNNLIAMDGWPGMRKCPAVLTPHPGEFSRLTGKGVGDIQSARQDAAVEAAATWADAADEPLVVVLKGAGTVVTDGRRVYVNATGNPGMASGGAGDVLTGLIAALIGQGLSPFEAACLGAYVHGLAGDLAAKEATEVSLMAADLLDLLPEAFKSL